MSLLDSKNAAAELTAFRRLRLERRLSQRDVADLALVSRTRVARLDAGLAVPPTVLARVCAGLGVAPPDVYDLDEATAGN
jgi:transcriptional regulator with XRE-family HTH domain